LEPSEGEQGELYDERTDRVFDRDVSGARLEPREKRGKTIRWNEPVHGGDGKEQDAKKSGDQRQGSVHRRMYTRNANFPLRRPPPSPSRGRRCGGCRSDSHTKGELDQTLVAMG